MPPSFKKSLFSKAIVFIIIANFVLTSGPLGYCSRVLAADNLRPTPVSNKRNFRGLGDDLIKDGGEAYVVTYDDPRSEEPGIAGGKCKQLAWAYNRGIPNPLGFSITVDAVRAYYRHNPQLIKMINEVRNLDVTNAIERKEASERIQKFMREHTEVPEDVKKSIETEYAASSRVLGYPEGEFVSFAYRGSGVIEDFEGEIPWFKTSIGAQAGQGTTVLNRRGPGAIEASVIEVISGLFNDQIFVYRDVQIFFDFVSKMKDVSEYKQLIKLAKKYNFDAVAARLEREASPGYVNLLKALEAIEKNEPQVKQEYQWKDRLVKSADNILEPMNFVTGVAGLEMVDSYLSGTAFTSHLGTGFDGSTYAKKTGGAFPSKPGDDFQGYTRYVKINFGPGLGPGIVEGKFQPNIVTLFDITGKGDWIPFEFMVGKKDMSLIYIDKVLDSIKHKLSEKQIRRLAALYTDWQSPSKQNEVRTVLKEEFNIQNAESWIRAMMDLWFYFDKPDKYKATAEEKQTLLKQLNLTDSEFFTMSYLVKHINGVATNYDTASYMLTSPEISTSRLLNEEALHKLADMIASVGNLMAQERFRAGDKGWRERRDIEFAIARCREDDPSKYKVKLEHVYDLVTGEDLGPGWVKIVHLQNRPVNPEREIQDPDNIIFRKMRVDEDFIETENIQPVAKNGLIGYGASEGQIYIVDPYRNLAEQEAEVAAMKDKGQKVVVVLEEMGPEHDPIVEKAGSAIVWRGNDTSHAYIFSLELKIPIVISATLQSEYKDYIQNGVNVVTNGAGGQIYPGDKGIPLVRDDLIIRVDMLPSTKAGIIVSTLQAAQEIARLGTKSVLTRMEYLINQQIKIYPQAGEAYDLMMALDKGTISEKDLTPRDIEDVAALRSHPEVIKQIRDTIAGFPTAAEFIAEQMHYASNFLGAIFPMGDKIRAYDNKEKEALLYGLIGAKLYLRYDDSVAGYNSPLVGMRGSQLMSHPHLKKGFLHLNRGIIRSIKDGFKNNSFFFVFLRNSQELRTQLEDLEKICEEEGVYPEEIGTMIELGGDIWFIDEVCDILVAFREKHKKDGVKKVFISFGTNDLTNASGSTSRDDRDFTGDVKVLHPALINVAPEVGRIEMDPGVIYGPKVQGMPFIISINDEAAPGIIRMIEHISSRSHAKGVEVSLCGQCLVKAINKGDVKTAMTIIAALDTFGTQSMTLVPATMIDYDTRTSETRVTEEVLQGQTPIAKLSGIQKEVENAVVIGKAAVISKAEDILALRKDDKQKIAVITSDIGTREELEEKGIPWDYLRYAGAILIDENVKELGILQEDPDVKKRVKAKISIVEPINSGEFLTVVYKANSVYRGSLPTYIEKTKLTEIRMPEEGLIPETRQIMRISASDLFVPQGNQPAAIDIHPLAFVLYKENPDLIPEDARSAIKQLIGNQDPLEYLQARFTEYVSSKTQEAIKSNLVPVYTVFRLTRNQMRPLKGGEAIEKTKGKEGINFDDPAYRLRGGARNISDFWQIFNLELGAFNTVKANTPQLAIQLSTQGARAQEILEAQLRVLKTFGITPQNQEIGLELTTSIDVIYVPDYIKQGIKYFTYNDRELAETLLATNFNHPDMFAVEGKDAMVDWMLPRPANYIRGIIAENKDRGVWLGLIPQQESATNTRQAVIVENAAIIEPALRSATKQMADQLVAGGMDRERAIIYALGDISKKYSPDIKVEANVIAAAREMALKLTKEQNVGPYVAFFDSLVNLQAKEIAAARFEQRSIAKKDGGKKTADISGVDTNSILTSVAGRDSKVFNEMSQGYPELLGLIKSVSDSKGMLIFGANNFFENPGLVTALEQFLTVEGSNLRFAVWASDAGQMKTLRNMGVGGVVQILEGKLGSIIDRDDVKKLIGLKRVVLVVSDADLENIKAEYKLKDVKQFFKDNPNLIQLHLQTAAITKRPGKRLGNSPTLIISQAVASILREKAVIDGYKEVVQNQGISEAEADKLINGLEAQVVQMPLVPLSEQQAEEFKQYRTEVTELLNRV
jgi:phosphoenolpyruvate synthase/pyruvate phosphate dikinase